MVEIQGIVQTHIITQINGIECYQIYFGYIKSDLDVILNEKQNYINTLEQQVEEQQVTIRDQYIELDSLRETVYMYNIYGK